MKGLDELRKLSLDELQAEVMILRKDQFNLRLKRANSSLDKTHHIKQLRRNIARVKTIMSQKVGSDGN
jgi:large subunit ribosomal protein L29